jgi:diketogulonate reductase-like aldo/keto reductase
MAQCNLAVPRCGGHRATLRVRWMFCEAVASGVNHIDTSDFYGPQVTNQIIKQALHPYPDGLVIVTKVGARRGADKSWHPALSRQELIDGVHDNLRNLGLDRACGAEAAGVDWPYWSEQRHSCAAGRRAENCGDCLRAELVQLAQRNDDGFIDNLAKKGLA